MKKPFVFVTLSLQLCYAQLLQGGKDTERNHFLNQFNTFARS